MTKRSAEYELDSKNLDLQIEKDKKDRQSTPEEIAQRKIYKLTDNLKLASAEPSKVQFTFAPVLPADKNGEAAPKVDIFSKTLEAPPVQVADIDTTKGTSLFKNDEAATKKSAQEPAVSQPNLFANLGLSKEAAKPQPAKQPSLFENLDSKKTFNFGGLFTSSGTTTPSLFGSSNGTTSLFGTNTTSLFGSSNTTSLFGSSTGTSSLFGNGSTLFNFTNTAPVRKDQESGEDEDGSADEEGNKQETIDKSKSTGKYEYKSDMEKHFSKLAVKYRLNSNDIVQNVEVSLASDKSTPPKHFLYVALNSTKNVIYTGAIIKEVSKIRNLNKKQQNLEVRVISTDSAGKLKKDDLKIMFASAEDGSLFNNEFTKCMQ